MNLFTRTTKRAWIKKDKLRGVNDSTSVPGVIETTQWMYPDEDEGSFEKMCRESTAKDLIIHDCPEFFHYPVSHKTVRLMDGPLVPTKQAIYKILNRDGRTLYEEAENRHKDGMYSCRYTSYAFTGRNAGAWSPNPYSKWYKEWKSRSNDRTSSPKIFFDCYSNIGVVSLIDGRGTMGKKSNSFIFIANDWGLCVNGNVVKLKHRIECKIEEWVLKGWPVNVI